MGGVSKWPVLTDSDISHTIPEVFAAPPEIVIGLMAREAEEAIRAWSPLAARILERRDLLRAPSGATIMNRRREGVRARFMRALRRAIFDRFGRR